MVPIAGRLRTPGLIVLTLSLLNCMSIPQSRLLPDITARELKSHVEFLAQSALRGRKPRTPGSRFARQYIVAHFKALGLETWGDANGYAQPFVIGTNIIGVLPGSDPAVAHEYILVSAHYDHLGEHQGAMHLGAADNASGVAAMLQIAERLAGASRRPRRSIVFAAFDAEEIGLLGAFAFTCRADFDAMHLAGVVNMDGLGRRSFEVLDDTLLVFGSERHTGARQAVATAAGAGPIRILPLGRDLVGPRSDHVAFEDCGAPVLFFTSGLYRDYHKPTDTADRIDYAKLQRETRAIAATAQALANADHVEQPADPTTGDRDELAALRIILEALAANPVEAGVADALLESVRSLAARAAELWTQQDYLLRDRYALVADVAYEMLPLVQGRLVDEQERAMLLGLSDAYTHHTTMFVRGWREMVRHLLAHPPLPFRGSPPFLWDEADTSERAILIEPAADDRLRLSVYAVNLTFAFPWGVQHQFYARDLSGTREELIDATLLEWMYFQLSGHRNWTPRVYRAVLSRLAGGDMAMDEWVRWRVQQSGHASADAWLIDRLDTASPPVRAWAVLTVSKALADEASWRLGPILRDDAAEPATRSVALHALAARPTPEALLEIVDGLGSDAPFVTNPVTQFVNDQSYPFYHRAGIRQARAQLSASRRSAPTLGQAAVAWLAQITGQDFGDDAQAWRDWIEVHAAKLQIAGAKP
jgi:hypothetical protein